MDINQVMAELLSENKKCKDEIYRIAYCDGVLDFYNKIKKEKRKKKERGESA